MALEQVPSLPDEEEATQEAWGYVAKGYEKALTVRGLADFEVQALRKSLLAVSQIVEHPTEIARRALMAAAEAESPNWAAVIPRFASALAHRWRDRQGLVDRCGRIRVVVP